LPLSIESTDETTNTITMTLPSATHEIETGASVPTNGHDKPQSGTVPLEPGLTKKQALEQQFEIKFPTPPTFTDKYAERQYQKGRLALAFRIFAKLGFDEGVAGHITLRVSVA
jgi:hypothetical protein